MQKGKKEKLDANPVKTEPIKRTSLLSEAVLLSAVVSSR